MDVQRREDSFSEDSSQEEEENKQVHLMDTIRDPSGDDDFRETMIKEINN
jgi:hypothetical protein